MSFWCGRGDLNPHAFRRHPLKMVCLPIPPLPLILSTFQRLLGTSDQLGEALPTESHSKAHTDRRRDSSQAPEHAAHAADLNRDHRLPHSYPAAAHVSSACPGAD